MTDRNLQIGLAVSGMTFYWYNELATMTIKATGPVTSSVANTAKRVIVMVYMAAVTGKARAARRPHPPQPPRPWPSPSRHHTLLACLLGPVAFSEVDLVSSQGVFIRFSTHKK